MNYKIVNIRNILKIILLVIIILSSIKSCAKAWTTEQFIEYCEQLSSNGDIPTNIRNKATLVVNHSALFIDNITDYTTIIVDANAGDIQFYCYNGEIPNPSVNKYGVLQFNNIQMKEGYITLNNNTFHWRNGTTQKSYFYDYYFGLAEFNSTFEEQIPNTYYLQNYYVQGFEYTPLLTDTITYGDYQNINAKKIQYTNMFTLLGRMNKFDATCDWYKYIMLDNNGSKIGSLKYHIGDNYYTAENMDYNIELKNVYVNTSKLYIGQVYTLVIYANDTDMQGDLFEFKYNQVFTYVFLRYNATISGGVITDPGSGDDYNIQNATNDNQNFWQQTFNDMFTLSSGDVQDLKTQMEEQIDLNAISGVEEELNVFEQIRDMQPTDFIISWNAVEYGDKNMSRVVQIIPSGEINFSEKVRNNSTAQRVHEYTKILVTSALAWLMIHEVWRCLCILLGIGTELYEDYADEHRIVETQNETYDYDTGVKTYRQTSRRGNKSFTEIRRENTKGKGK